MSIVINTLFKNISASIPHFTEGRGGIPGAIADLRAQLATFLGLLTPYMTDEILAPPAASTTAIKTAAATTVAPQVFTSANFNGALANTTFSPPRPITVTVAGATPSDAPATVVFTGTDVDGNVITDTVTVPQTATTATSAKAFATLTQAAFAAGDGTGATLALGIGAALGLAKKIKLRGGVANLVAVQEAGTRLNPGSFATVTVPASMGPNGAYTPTTAADGSRNYTLVYEVDG